MERQFEDRDEDAQTLVAMKESFNSLLDQNKPASKSYVMEKHTYDQYLRALMDETAAASSPSIHLPRFTNQKRFKVMYDGDHPYLARTHSNKRLFHKEELFWAIFSAHRRCNHGDGKVTYDVAKEFADNIFLWECYLVTKICYCKRRKQKPSSSRMVYTTSPRYKAGDLHLVNMENSPDKSYRWIMLYKIDDTKFIFERPLRSRENEEIAFELLHIFQRHGSPLFLHSSLSKGHVLKILSLLYSYWPSCPTVYGQLFPYDCHTEFFTRMLDDWRNERNGSGWSIGCAFVASSLNSQHIAVLGSSPFELMHRKLLSQDISNCASFIPLKSGQQYLNADKDDNADTVAEVEIMPDIDQSNAIPDFPMRNYESVDSAELERFMDVVKIIENRGRGECLFFVISQHLKAFTQVEFAVSLLRRQVSEYLQQNDLGKAFIQEFHPDIDANDLTINTGGREAWGGPETLFAISQLFNLEVTLLSYVRRDGIGGPYLTKYWSCLQSPPSTMLSVPSTTSLVVRYEASHYTLLLPKELTYPPKSFKRKRSLSA